MDVAAQPELLFNARHGRGVVFSCEYQRPREVENGTG